MKRIFGCNKDKVSIRFTITDKLPFQGYDTIGSLKYDNNSIEIGVYWGMGNLVIHTYGNRSDTLIQAYYLEKQTEITVKRSNIEKIKEGDILIFTLVDD